MYNPNLHFHFTGIGGSGMSGIAEILLGLGFVVSGSDARPSEALERLERLGAKVVVGHEHELPHGCSLLVYSSAIAADNRELVEARRRNIPVVRRAEVLAELMRLKFGVGVAGSHGKTTTTSMVAAVLEHGGLDPTVVIGGQVKSISSGGKLGQGRYLVAETDESDRSFLLMRPTIAVVTNIDREHLNAYASLAELESSFEQFVRSVPFYGLAILCIDDPKVRDIAARLTTRKVTYGFSPDADIRLHNVSHTRTSTHYDVQISGGSDGTVIGRVRLPMMGAHLALNSLAAIAVGREFGIPLSRIREALESFSGVQRRLEVCGEVGRITVMSDYGHHPAEVRVTLAAVRAAWGDELRHLHVVFQPHRYSRTRDCFAQFLDAFGDADDLILTDIYGAGEAAPEDLSGETLFRAIHHESKRFIPHLPAVPDSVLERCKPGDVVLCLGAGSVGTLPDQLLSRLGSRVETDGGPEYDRAA